MKIKIKLAIFSLIMTTACYGQTVTKQNQISLRTQTDSLNYTLGVANGEGIRNYYLKNKPLDEFISIFIKYLDAGFSTDSQFIKPDSTNKYAEIIELGNKVGSALKAQVTTGLIDISGIKVDIEIIKKGLDDGLRNNFSVISAEGAQRYLQETINKISQENISPEDKLNKTACEEFLAKNKLREGVITTASGLQYEILKKGNGATPSETSKVKVLYVGRKIDGTVFDDMSKSNQAIVFELSETIKGWIEAIQLMQVGSKFRIYIPQELGYGIVKTSEIQPYSALIFEIELLSIEK